jgi:hypothetical protein
LQDEALFADTVALTGELEIWRKRMVRRLTPARDHFPELYRLATGTEHAPSGWTARDYPPIRTFLIQALDHAEQTRNGAQPIDAYNTEVLRRVFGLTDDTANATVRERQQSAAGLIPDLYTHYEMTEPEVRGQQIEALIDASRSWHSARQAAQHPTPKQPQSSGRDASARLIGRAADLEWLAQSRNQLKDVGGLFGIWGLDGIGKTALAEQFAWTIGPERTATIHVGQPGHYAEDLRSALTKAGHAVPDASPEQYEAAFRRHASNLGDLWLLILDGVTGGDDLDRLGVDKARIPMLAVARERITAGHADGRDGATSWRHIGPLDPKASLHLMTQHLPDFEGLPGASKEDLEALAALMGGHAATLEAVSRLLPELSEQDVGELLTQVGRTPGESLASLTRFTGDRELRIVAKPLSWIIRNKLTQLADDTVARTVLTVVVACSDSGRLLREFLDPVVPDLLGRTLWSRELEFAFDRLAQMGLVTVTGDEVSTGRLVCHLARYEVLDQAVKALLAYERVVAVPASPWTPVNYQLNYRRRLYEIASGYGRSREAIQADPTNSRLVLVDENYFAHYITGADGIRRVTLFRLLPMVGPLRLSGLQDGWVLMDEVEYDDTLEPMLEGFFDPVFSAALDPAALEAKYGPDQSQWPTTMLDALETIDGELAENLRAVDPDLK